MTAADVIIEVLDARDPLGSRCLDVERFVRKSGATKKIILLLNKVGECSLHYAAATDLCALGHSCSTKVLQT